MRSETEKRRRMCAVGATDRAREKTADVAGKVLCLEDVRAYEECIC